MATKKECQNIVLSSAKKILIAPYDATKLANGTAKASATDIGFTSGNVTITGAVEKNLVMVDQSATPVREIVTAVNLNLGIPTASITLANLALALQVQFGADGKASFLKEAYYSVWIESDGPKNDQGHNLQREILIEKVSFSGTGELAFSRTDIQNPTIEGKLIWCPDPENPDYIGLTITETDPDESAS